MVNHPNRNAATIDTLRTHLVPVKKKIKNAEFSKIDRYFGERILLVASWENKQVCVTVVTGCYRPPQITYGEAETFEIQPMFKKGYDVSDQIGFGEGDRPKPNFNKMYQQFILDHALEAQEILDNVPFDESVSEEIKAQIRSVLNPYFDEYTID